MPIRLEVTPLESEPPRKETPLYAKVPKHHQPQSTK